MSLGQTIVGGCASLTVTVKLQVVLMLPLASVALQDTVVTPCGKVEPDGGVQLLLGFGSQASLAVGLKVTTAPAGLVQVVVMLAGQLTVGAAVSDTVTVKLQALVLVLPAESMAVQLTVLTPDGKPEPEGGEQETLG